MVVPAELGDAAGASPQSIANILRVYWGYIGIMEKKLETTILYRSYMLTSIIIGIITVTIIVTIISITIIVIIVKASVSCHLVDSA